MIELFVIFSKGGIVFWTFNEAANFFKNSVNELISEVILKEGSSATTFHKNNYTFQYKLDNELDLMFLVVYQSVVQLSYSDKLLSEVQMRFRDMYKNIFLENYNKVLSKGTKLFTGFDNYFLSLYEVLKNSSGPTVKQMRTFEESAKSQKTVASMIESRGGVKTNNNDKANKKKKAEAIEEKNNDGNSKASPPKSPRMGVEEDEETLKNREVFMRRMKSKGKGGNPSEKQEKDAGGKKGKAKRVWDLSGKADDVPALDYTDAGEDGKSEREEEELRRIFEQNRGLVGKLKGALPGLDENLRSEEENEEDGEDLLSTQNSGGGWFSSFKNLVGNKKFTEDDLKPALDKMKETLISKNVAAEPAERLCASVAKQLDGKVFGTFSRVATIVREALRESLGQLLSPKRRVNILRDIQQAKEEKRPYVIVFCGVNGVGKSTNLAKITFWLAENGHRILIAAGDTFRAGAVEQLRTHTRNINALHPSSVQLYEQGYGKNPSTLAASAIGIAVEREIDVVLVDTAGRMQNNEPLMRALSKLINDNKPDLVLFVGEALVGNEAVDQLVKFNQALADHTEGDTTPRLIDGIVLTKFDTVDDKVGAAISMTYITGQPIIFVGTGQTYGDLKNLNVDSVVNSLIK